jgi:ribonuclease J
MTNSILKKNKDSLLFLPLGGSGEIGMNLNLYHYMGKWIIIDCGAGFADDYYPGVDMLVPDIEFIHTIKDDIVGLVLTHAHEDHLGAVQYIWPAIECPIYTTKFTASFLREKLKETDFYKRVKIHEVDSGGAINLDPFTIDLMPLSHSAPEMNAMLVKTPVGNVFHTGDWKFDKDPLIGESNNEDRLAEIGNQGVLAMIGDSTNVFNPGHSGSEGDLRKSLIELISSCKKMVVVTTFASNVARLETIATAAQAAGRKVIITGRSLWRILSAAQEAGYLKEVEFLDDSQMKNHPRDKILVIATGCQGEPMAQMNKIATNSHPAIRLAPDDSVIFSSKIIPGNDKKIFRLFNNLVLMGANVLTEKDHFVHVSGHPGCEELEKMYKLIKPEIAIPVHGEHVHMHEHARLALTWGAKKAFQITNGEIVKLAPGNPESLMQVPSGYYAIDGFYLVHSESDVLKKRRKLRDAGIIIISLIINGKKSLMARPTVTAPGSLESDDEVLDIIADEIEEVLFQNEKGGKIDTDRLDNIARSVTRRVLKNELGKKPVIEVLIQEIK